ncbi:MAG: lipopolysaccharide biosynthesis protein RfbH [Candidatus Competibacteraceae bacterium]|nr:lipopolysaccharide biosynthesis protein RfbH [Candidatus Competibacteraceae bacterium]
MPFKIQAGGIYKLPFPFTDLSSKKARPALALSAPDVNGDIRFLFITTTPVRSSERGYAFDAGDYAGTPLPFPSFLRLDKPFLLHQSLVIKPLAQLSRAAFARVFRRLIIAEIPCFAELEHGPRPFVSGTTLIPPSGKVVGAPELENMVEAALDGWLTTGRFNTAFEQELGKFLDLPHVLTVNSGSSANLLAVSALCSPSLGERALQPGDEVLTVAAGFPTTVNPILVNGLTPVFVDVELGTYNVDVEQLAAAIGPRTRAIMLAHTLGNPFNLDVVTRLAHEHGLWLVEDCCDALGSTWRSRKVGTFGDVGTLSFYPAHHITMGEGGAVFTRDPLLARIVASIRDWGRDCWCAPGRDNTCGKRFDWRLGKLPVGYDHKYVYSHLGYNLKITDMQAACGLAQLERLPGLIEARRRHFRFLRERLQSCEEFLLLPEATPGSEPSWFGFPVTLRESAGTTRLDLLRYLDQYRIGVRLLFAGNLTRQPYFANRQYRIAGNLTVTDLVAENTFWLGLWPGLDTVQLDYLADRLEAYFGAGF